VLHRAERTLHLGILQKVARCRHTVQTRTTHHSFLVSVCLTLLLIMLWMVVIGSPHTLAAATTVIIHITGPSQPPGFRPMLITVHAGDTIIFLNDAQVAATYTIAADDHSFISPPIASGQQWNVTISTLGTYEYRALDVPQAMVGAIIVAPASVKLLSTPAPGAVATEIATLRMQQTHPAGPAPPPSGLSFTLLMVVVVVVLAALTAGGLFLVRQRRQT
jgi:plastocyanin